MSAPLQVGRIYPAVNLPTRTPVFCSAARTRPGLEWASSPGRQMVAFSLNMQAMAENHELAKATARLDALTDWERRPREMIRVGLEQMIDLAGRLGDPQNSFRSIHV